MKTAKANTSIGVKELKARASEIVGNVRRGRRRYTVTLRGQPVAILAPIDDARASVALPPSLAGDGWETLMQMGSALAAQWPKGVSGVDVLSEMRR